MTCASCTYAHMAYTDRHIYIFLKLPLPASPGLDQKNNIWNFHPRCRRYVGRYRLSEDLTSPPPVPHMCGANSRSVPEQESQGAAAQPVRPTAPKYCLGLLGRACQFGERGGAARLHGRQKCIFCDLTKLNQAFLEGPSSVDVRKRFNRLTPQAQVLALNRVSDPGYRHWLQQHRLVRNEAMSQPAPTQGPLENSSWKQTDPFTPSELAEKYRMAQSFWSAASESRRGLRTLKESVSCSLCVLCAVK